MPLAIGLSITWLGIKNHSKILSAKAIEAFMTSVLGFINDPPP
jgi:hypothetical protein